MAVGKPGSSQLTVSLGTHEMKGSFRFTENSFCCFSFLFYFPPYALRRRWPRAPAHGPVDRALLPQRREHGRHSQLRPLERLQPEICPRHCRLVRGGARGPNHCRRGQEALSAREGCITIAQRFGFPSWACFFLRVLECLSLIHI